MDSLRADVTLVPLDLQHAPQMVEWMADPTVRDGIGLRRDATLASTEEWIHRAQQDSTLQAFAILFSGKHVGNVILDRRDDYLKSVRLSIYLGETSARGAGVGSAALNLALQHAFTELNLHKVWLTVHAENHSAIASYLRAGFVLEGIHRDEFLIGERRLSAHYMGILRHEFEGPASSTKLAKAEPQP